MAIPQNNEAMSTYIIYRDIPAGEPFDPTSPLVFFPPKGSDELFDALRIAFPHVKSHSERMRDAIIQYLLEERQEEQVFQNTSPTTTMDAMPTPWPSMSSDSNSLLSSPELLNFGTPATSFANSPQPQAAQLTRQTSIATSGGASAPTLDAMTGVFSVSTSEQPKQRMRRKMTEAEKIEYRKRRIVKACDKCAKRKRKCPHNQTEMENVPTANKASARVSKSISPRSGKSITPPSAQQETLFDPCAMAMDDLAFLDNLDPTTMAPIEDFNMFDEPFPEFDMNQFNFDNFATNATSGNFFTPDASPTQLDWLHDPTEAFQLQDPSQTIQQASSNRRTAQPTNTTDQQGRGNTSLRLPLAVDIPQLTRSGSSLDSSASSDAQSSWEGYGLEGGFMVDGGQHHVGGRDGMLWEHLRTGQIEKPIPTHTAHIHGVGCGGTDGLQDVGRSQSSTLPTTLPQTVLRLTGTKKALETFAGLPNAGSNAILRTVSIEEAAIALRSNAAHLRANRRSTEHGLSTSGAVNANVGLRGMGELASMTQLRENAATVHRRVRNANAGVSSTGELAEMVELRENAAALSGRARNANIALSSSDESHSSRQQSRPQSAANVASMLLQPPTGPETGRAQLHLQQQRRPEPTLGEGIPENADPSVQHYMTRRRTAMNMHTLVGANMNAGLPGSGTTGGAGLPSRSTNSSPGQMILFADKSQLQRQTSSSANGGAYPRLEKEAATSSSSRQPTLSNFTGITGALHKQDLHSGEAASSTTQSRPSYHMLLCDHHGRTPSTTEVPLLSHGTDTNRFRDHHGRPSNSFAAASALVFFFVVWLSGFGAAVAPSLLLLAFLQVHDSKPSIAQCSGKNSWWLSTFATQQLGASGVWQAKMHGRDGNWFEGLMHPHCLSPLRPTGL